MSAWTGPGLGEEWLGGVVIELQMLRLEDGNWVRITTLGGPTYRIVPFARPHDLEAWFLRRVHKPSTKSRAARTVRNG